ncbi:hypothetical protein [Prescottella equi]|uniref:hypothetical protein n=1 Tax=Rhodococcus hoagii TaxID=43767 RepID=UPI000A947D6A|nr:hypothetical protein [Prescottella equi]
MAATATDRCLPVAWDGHPVEWGPFSSTVFICRVEADGTSTAVLDMCWNCGVHADRVQCEGRVDIPHFEYVLHLYRCTRCGHDQVQNPRTRDLWDLDESDYGPDGSWEEP